jgi:hypothetical protein
MAHTPLKMTITQAQEEVRNGWTSSYSAEAMAKAVEALHHKPLGYRISIFLARMCFRGIYFPQMGRLAWLKLIFQNRRTIADLVGEAFEGPRRQSASNDRPPTDPAEQTELAISKLHHRQPKSGVRLEPEQP